MSTKIRWCKSLNHILATILLLASANITLAQTTRTTLVQSSNSGDGLTKKVIAIIGDGFSTEADQTTYENWVTNNIMNGSFGEGPLLEDLNAFDIYRIDAESNDSGVTQVNASGTVTVSRDTALDYRYSGIWGRCWFEKGPNTNTRTAAILNDVNLSPDFIVILLNETGFGGCRRGIEAGVTLSSGWTTMSHELGHSIGGLCDEYTGSTGATTYTGGEPGCVNLTINTNRDTIKWGEFVDPNTPLPTIFNAATMNTTQTAGAFVGGTLGAGNTFNAGIWHPSWRGRMNNNTTWNPIGYNRMKQVLDPHHDHDFEDSYVGDFNGDGSDDVVIHNGNAIALYLSNQTNNLNTTQVYTGTVPGAAEWTIKRWDRLHIGDFNKDGRDDIYITNSDFGVDKYVGMLRSDGNGFTAIKRYKNALPNAGNYPMGPTDQFLVGDFNKDGRDDLIVINLWDYNKRVLTVYRSNQGTALKFQRRYQDTLPGWTMKSEDEFYVADFNNDGRDDLYLFNRWDWSTPQFGMIRSNGKKYINVKRYNGSIPGWTLRQWDQFYVGDWNGDNKDDLFVFNGFDWDTAFLGTLKSTGKKLEVAQVYSDNVPGWAMRPDDRHYVGDINNDGRADLYTFNDFNWGPNYLGRFVTGSDGTISAGWHENNVGTWTLEDGDQFLVANFDSDNQDELFVHRNNWFGLLNQTGTGTTLEAVARHRTWIHDHLFHRDGLW